MNCVKYVSTSFDEYSGRYESWFEKNPEVYKSELKAVEMLLPEGKGVEVGVGSGRFSEPFSMELGVDPSTEMLKLSKKRGIEVVRGVGEELPLKDSSFDFGLIITTICFFEDTWKALKEAHRIIKYGGHIVIGLVDRKSEVGRAYQKKKRTNVFYKDANFYSVDEVELILRQAGFEDLFHVQTIFGDLYTIEEFQEPTEGYGEGSFVVIRGRKG